MYTELSRDKSIQQIPIDTKIYPEIYLLVGKLRPCCIDRSLGGSRANRRTQA